MGEQALEAASAIVADTEKHLVDATTPLSP